MRTLARLALLCSLAAAVSPAPAEQPHEGDWAVSLVDVAHSAGLRHPSVYGGVDRKRFIVETNGTGVAFLDYDNDGWLDVLLLSGTRLEDEGRREEEFPPGQAPTNRLYRNRGDGTFQDVTAPAGLERNGWASSVCAGDYDNDGWLDLFVTYYGRNVLYRNRQGRRFDDVTEAAGLASPDRRWGSGCTFLDFDRDGLLDLFVAHYLVLDLETAPEPGEGRNCRWKGLPVNCGPNGLPTDTNQLFHNEGDGRFRDVSEESGVGGVEGRYSMTAVAADLDEDGWVDIYVACDSTAAIQYRNEGDGTFTDVSIGSGSAYNDLGNAQAGMGLATGDYNRDGRLDLLKTHFADDVPALYRNLGRGLFEDVAALSGLAVLNRHVEWGAGLPDLDNDGWPDVVYVTGHVYPELERDLPQYAHRGPRVIFRNLGGRRFALVTDRSGPAPAVAHSSRGAAFGDFDNDGDVDVLVMNMNEVPSLLRNDYGGTNGWIQIRLEGQRSNRLGLGATVIVSSGGSREARAVLSQTSYYSHSDIRLHFGLGVHEKADEIEVRWPSGHVDTLRDVAGRRVVTIREGDGARAISLDIAPDSRDSRPKPTTHHLSPSRRRASAATLSSRHAETGPVGRWR